MPGCAAASLAARRPVARLSGWVAEAGNPLESSDASDVLVDRAIGLLAALPAGDPGVPRRSD
jgi:hypothetical protein